MYCHDCRRDFTVELDMDLDGNHVFECPHCGHEHCRVVKDGVVTGDRWDQRNGPVYTAATYVTTAAITNTDSTFTMDAWQNASSSQPYYGSSTLVSGSLYSGDSSTAGAGGNSGTNTA